MASCEYCWSLSALGEYSKTIARAEAEGWPCTKNDEEGARLRAGRFWDEATQTDTRFTQPDASPAEAFLKVPTEGNQ